MEGETAFPKLVIKEEECGCAVSSDCNVVMDLSLPASTIATSRESFQIIEVQVLKEEIPESSIQSDLYFREATPEANAKTDLGDGSSPRRGAVPSAEQTNSSSSEYIEAEMEQEQDGDSGVAPVLSSSETRHSPPGLESPAQQGSRSVGLVDCCTSKPGQEVTNDKENKCGEDPHLVCGENLNAETRLQVHQPVHTKEKPYPCLQCRRGFRRAANLRRHQLTHTGENPYGCQQCGKSFSGAADLKVHQRVHTGEKRYECGQCGKRFTQAGTLKEHRNVHTGVRPFHCQPCGKSFTWAGNLRTHRRRVHTGEKPYRGQPGGEQGVPQATDVGENRHIQAGHKPFDCRQSRSDFAQEKGLEIHRSVQASNQWQQREKSVSGAGRLRLHEYVPEGEKAYCVEGVAQLGFFPIS